MLDPLFPTDRTCGQTVTGPYPGVPAAQKDQDTGAPFPKMTPGFPGIEAGQRSDLRRPCWLVAKRRHPLHGPSLSVLSGVGWVYTHAEEQLRRGNRRTWCPPHQAPAPAPRGACVVLLAHLFGSSRVRGRLSAHSLGELIPGWMQSSQLPSGNKHSPPSRSSLNGAFP